MLSPTQGICCPGSSIRRTQRQLGMCQHQRQHDQLSLGSGWHHHQQPVLPVLHALPGTVCEPVSLANTAAAVVVVPAAALLPSAVDKLVTYLKPRKCKVCCGAGYYPCTTCLGRHKVGGLIPEAGPSGPCTCCVRGRMACTECGKTGLANAWLWQPSSDPGWGARGE